MNDNVKSSLEGMRCDDPDPEDVRNALIQVFDRAIVTDALGRAILDRNGAPCLFVRDLSELDEIVDSMTRAVRVRARNFTPVNKDDKHEVRMALRNCKQGARQKRDDYRGAANVLQRGATTERSA